VTRLVLSNLLLWSYILRNFHNRSFCSQNVRLQRVYYALAFQGFYKRRIIIRDIALVHVHSSSVVQHLLFKSPSAHFESLPEKFKKTNRSLSDSFHGISWCSGFAQFHDLHLSEAIYVKGRQIQTLIKNMNRDADVINLEDCGCNERIEDLPPCNWHKFETTKCASVSTRAVAHWLHDNCYRLHIPPPAVVC
jgi:hypothetical protein